MAAIRDTRPGARFAPYTPVSSVRGNAITWASDTLIAAQDVRLVGAAGVGHVTLGADTVQIGCDASTTKLDLATAAQCDDVRMGNADCERATVVAKALELQGLTTNSIKGATVSVGDGTGSVALSGTNVSINGTAAMTGPSLTTTTTGATHITGGSVAIDGPTTLSGPSLTVNNTGTLSLTGGQVQVNGPTTMTVPSFALNSTGSAGVTANQLTCNTATTSMTSTGTTMIAGADASVSAAGTAMVSGAQVTLSGPTSILGATLTTNTTGNTNMTASQLSTLATNTGITSTGLTMLTASQTTVNSTTTTMASTGSTAISAGTTATVSGTTVQMQGGSGGVAVTASGGGTVSLTTTGSATVSAATLAVTGQVTASRTVKANDAVEMVTGSVVPALVGAASDTMLYSAFDLNNEAQIWVKTPTANYPLTKKVMGEALLYRTTNDVNSYLQLTNAQPLNVWYLLSGFDDLLRHYYCTPASDGMTVGISGMYAVLLRLSGYFNGTNKAMYEIGYSLTAGTPPPSTPCYQVIGGNEVIGGDNEIGAQFFSGQWAVAMTAGQKIQFWYRVLSGPSSVSLFIANARLTLARI